ncbi:hypothetical protein [Meiothermus phage MMP17]|nr:hypothetical protein [Meiothermus phage MMP17]
MRGVTPYPLLRSGEGDDAAAVGEFEAQGALGFEGQLEPGSQGSHLVGQLPGLPQGGGNQKRRGLWPGVGGMQSQGRGYSRFPGLPRGQDVEFVAPRQQGPLLPGVGLEPGLLEQGHRREGQGQISRYVHLPTPLLPRGQPPGRGGGPR